MDWRYVAVVPFAAAVLYATVKELPRLWRHQNPVWDHKPASWPWSETTWHRFVRTWPTGLAFGCLLLFVIVSAPLIPEQPRDSFGFVRPAWYSLPLAVSPFLFFGLCLSIYLVNRPRFLVPPHLRDGPDALR
jgi:hypothetical protein